MGLMEGEESTAALMELVRLHVPVIDVPWLHQLEKGSYCPLQVAVSQCTVPGIKKAERRRKRAEDVAEASKKQKNNKSE